MRRRAILAAVGLALVTIAPSALAGPTSTTVAAGPGEHRIIPSVCESPGVFEATVDLDAGTGRIVGQSGCPFQPDTLTGCHKRETGAIACTASSFPGHDSRLLINAEGQLFYESRQTGAFVNVTADATVASPGNAT